jgi:hypothetical protein
VRIPKALYSIVLMAALGGCANQAANQAANQDTNQAANQDTNQAANQGTNQAANQAANQNANQAEINAVAASAAWTEPSRYKFTLTSSCGERALIGRFKVTVEGGLVTRNEGLDDSARRALMLRLAKLVPTLGDLEAEADTARKERADQVVVEVDPVDGHPTSIRIDHDANAIDDESCYDISDYSVG